MNSQSKQRVLNGAHGSEVFRAQKASPSVTAPVQADESFASDSRRDDSELPDWLRIEKPEHINRPSLSPEILLHSDARLPSVFGPTRELRHS